MSFRLIEREKNISSQDTLFVLDSRETEIKIEKRDSESKMINEIEQLIEKKKKLTHIEFKNEDEK